jgi:ABC-type multidrug transport system fused ATPase/permease subunit
MALALACGLGATLMQVLKPWPIKVLFDGVLLPATGASPLPGIEPLLRLPPDTLIALACLGLLLVSFVWGLLSYGQAYLTARAGQSAVFALRQRAYAHLQRLSLAYHRRRQRGDLLMRLTGDINVLRDMIVDALILGAGAAFMLGTMIAVMLLMDRRLALLVLLLLPPLALTTVRFSARIRTAARRQRRNEGRAAALIHEMLAGIFLIQATGGERQSEEAFGSSNRESQKAGLRTTRLEASQSRAVEILLAAGTAGVLWYGAHRVRAGVLTPGDLLVFVSYVQSALRPLRHLARVSTRLSKAIVSAERVYEILRTEPEVRDGADARPARRVEGRLELRDVSFRHDGGPEVLHRVSVAVPAGGFLGIVGPSGAGKSTILALLLRLYDPLSGRILLDDRDLRRYRLLSLRERMGVVLQDPLLFGATVKENIAFGRPGAPQEEIERAARLAGAHEFIVDLAKGYDTPIAEAGASLSGGQRQRLCIARAFLRDAPILLLDEPTFGLDPASEAAVTESIRRLAAGRTTVLVAHRLAAVRHADAIIVLRRGRIEEQGSFEELRSGDGWFARAWARQAAGDPAAVPVIAPAAAPADPGEPPAQPLETGTLRGER